MVFPDPGFGVTEFVEKCDQFEVPLDRQRRIDTGRVHQRQEDPELQRHLEWLERRHPPILPRRVILASSRDRTGPSTDRVSVDR
jgi:hypothetical protein